MAYPYLPGSHSEAFKGVSVLAGLMLSGFSLMYSRSLRPGEYVKAGDTEGTVMNIGLFATRIHTGMGEEVSIPNAVMFSQPVRNFSRLVTDGHFVVHTTVTIGYATPWRQVHAMLLEAARRTPGVAQTPSPYVLQTALSDFYVEYRMCAQIDKSAPARRAEALNQLHGNIQDVFNEYGVQISRRTTWPIRRRRRWCRSPDGGPVRHSHRGNLNAAERLPPACGWPRVPGNRKALVFNRGFPRAIAHPQCVPALAGVVIIVITGLPVGGAQDGSVSAAQPSTHDACARTAEVIGHASARVLSAGTGCPAVRLAGVDEVRKSMNARRCI